MGTMFQAAPRLSLHTGTCNGYSNIIIPHCLILDRTGIGPQEKRRGEITCGAGTLEGICVESRSFPGLRYLFYGEFQYQRPTSR
jgi:hypothetical protein